MGKIRVDRILNPENEFEKENGGMVPAESALNPADETHEDNLAQASTQEDGVEAQSAHPEEVDAHIQYKQELEAAIEEGAPNFSHYILNSKSTIPQLDKTEVPEVDSEETVSQEPADSDEAFVAKVMAAAGSSEHHEVDGVEDTPVQVEPEPQVEADSQSHHDEPEVEEPPVEPVAEESHPHDEEEAIAANTSEEAPEVAAEETVAETEVAETEAAETPVAEEPETSEDVETEAPADEVLEAEEPANEPVNRIPVVPYVEEEETSVMPASHQAEPEPEPEPVQEDKPTEHVFAPVPLFPETEEMPKKTKKKSKKKLVIALVTSFVLLVAVGCVAAYAIYFHNRALPGTVVAGQSVSGMKPAQVEKLIQDRIDSTELHVKGVAQVHTNLKEIGVKGDAAKTVKQIFQRNKSFMSYVKAPFTTKKYQIQTGTDYNKLYGFAAALIAGPEAYDQATAGSATETDQTKAGPQQPAAKTDPAQAATLKKLQAASEKVSAEDKARFRASEFPTMVGNKDFSAFTIKDGVPGNGIDPNEMLKAALQALNGSGNGTFNATMKKFAPMRTKKDLEPFLKKADDLLKHNVTITYKGETIKPTAEDRVLWVKVPDASAPKIADPAYDPEAVKVWVENIANDKYVAPVNGQRNIDPSGKVTMIVAKAKDGLQITNVEQIYKGIVDSLNKKTDYKGTFETGAVPAKWEEKHVVANADRFKYQPGVDEKWIDLDLSKLTVTGYIGDKVSIGPISMVPGAPLTPTVTGTFKIYMKVTSQTMRGFNVDGSRYVTPGVPWIMYFHGGYALHGAPWRGVFGTMAYGGSHGCVNLPVPSAKQLYDWAEVGTVVSSHH